MSPLTTYFVTFGGFLLFIGLMALGVIFANKRIKGSCGGLNAVMNDEGEKVCGVCGLNYDDIKKGSADCGDNRSELEKKMDKTFG